MFDSHAADEQRAELLVAQGRAGRAGVEPGVAFEERLLGLLGKGLVGHPRRMDGSAVPCNPDGRPVAITVEASELPVPALRRGGPATACGSGPARSAASTSARCAAARWRPSTPTSGCTSCGWRDSCCDWSGRSEGAATGTLETCATVPWTTAADPRRGADRRAAGRRRRRRVVAALVLGSSTVAEVRAATGLSARAVATALARLVDGELVVRGDDGRHVLLGEAFRRAAIAAAPERPSPTRPARCPRMPPGCCAPSSGAAAVSIPTQRSKQLIVLDRLAQEFDVGQRYTERQVNAILRRFHEDVAPCAGTSSTRSSCPARPASTGVRAAPDRPGHDRRVRRSRSVGPCPAPGRRRPRGSSGWLADAVVAGGGRAGGAGAPTPWCGRRRRRPTSWPSPRRPPAAPLGAAPVGRHRAVRRRRRRPRRPHLDLRQGRLRRAGGRAGPHAAARRLRGFGTYARATSWGLPRAATCSAPVVVARRGRHHRVVPAAAGAVRLRRHRRAPHAPPIAGADRVVALDGLDDALRGADALVLALALTPETDHLIDRRRLDLLGEHAWVVNVARGRAHRHRRPRRRPGRRHHRRRRPRRHRSRAAPRAATRCGRSATC